MMKFFREPYREMDSAPRDGSIIELKCYFGIEPWVSKAKWVQDPVAGSIWQMISDSPWKSYVEDRYCLRQDGAGIASLKWRPVRCRSSRRIGEITMTDLYTITFGLFLIALGIAFLIPAWHVL